VCDAFYFICFDCIFTVRSVVERGIAMIGLSVVCLSVRPSVTLVDCDHTRWNSSKIISRPWLA